MLVTLNVKNFAIIDNIQVDFNKGLTVLTGETFIKINLNIIYNGKIFYI